jgi:hypothetical protein
MKKIFLIFLIYLVACVSYAQQIRYGIKGGLNLSDIAIVNYINPDAESQYNIKAGWHGGIFSAVDLNERFSLAAELLYSGKGVKAADRINLHYITLPFLTQYKVTEKVLAEFGPEIGYLFSARSRLGDVSNTWNNKLDLGLDAGFQINLSSSVFFGMRFNAGISSVINHIDESATNYVSNGENIKYQNRVLQLFFGYLINEKVVR